MTVANVNVTKVLFKRGNTAQNNSYTGVSGEITIDTQAKTLRIHDGTTSGGNIITAVLTGNAGSQQEAIDSLGANVGAYQLFANANAVTQTVSINSINANLGAFQTFSNSNAATQATSINSINANLGAFQTYANITLSTIANAASQETAINSLNANVGAFQTLSNSNAASQTTAINSLNANVGAYQIFANANASTQTTEINALRANITAANTAISSLQSNAAIQAALLDTLTGNAATQSTVLDTLTANAASQATTLTTLLSNAVAQQTSLIDLVANAAVQAQFISNTNANTKSYLSAFDGNIIPSANVTYSLGDSTHQWKDLWVSNNTIYIGNTPIRVDGSTLLINGSPITGTTANLVNGAYTLSLFANGQSQAPDTVFAGNGFTVLDTVGNVQGGIYSSGDLEYFNIGASAGRGFKFYVNEEDIGPLFFANGAARVPGELASATRLKAPEGNIGGLGMYGSTLYVTDPTSEWLYLQPSPESWAFVQLPSDATANVANIRIHNDVGNIEIGTGDGNVTYYHWLFNKDGNLVIPGNINYANGVSILSGLGGAVTGNIAVDTGAIQFVASSSGDGNGYSTIRLIPDTNLEGLDQFLVIDPTAPGHIHIRAGGDQDSSSADLILGGENSHVLITSGSNPPVYIRANSASWMFGVDSSLSMPTGGNLYFDSSAVSVIDGFSSLRFATNSLSIGSTSGFASGQNYDAVALGASAGQVSQGEAAIAIGKLAGNVNQRSAAIAVGRTAGRDNQGIEAISIGADTGQQNQGSYAIAIGSVTAYLDQGIGAVAIGASAGAVNQGTHAIAIGTGAGNGNQGNSSIILNATGSPLDQTTDNTFTVKPIRNAASSTVLYYDASTGEITYDTAGAGAYGNANVATYLPTYTGNIAANITKNGYSWNFGTDGKLTIPGTIQHTTTTSQVILTQDTFRFESNVGTGSSYIEGQQNDLFLLGGLNTVVGAGGSTWEFTANGNINLATSGNNPDRGIVFGDGTFQSTAWTGSGGNTGNVTFNDTTISTTGGAGQGIILNSAGSGEIAMLDYVGINNTNPGYWLHIGDGAPGAVNNTGNISIDYNNGLDSSRASTIIGYAWWDAGGNGNNNRGIGAHRQFGIYKNDDLYTTKYLEIDLNSGNANLTNIAVTRVTTTNGIFWANGALYTTSDLVLGANVGAYQLYANANAATQQTSIDLINANIGAYQIYANANATTQQTSIDTKAPSASPTFSGTLTSGGNIVAQANVTINNNLSVLGNLLVQGTTTTVNSTTLSITDKFITVANSSTNNSEANGAGIYVPGSAANILYTSVDDSWTLNKTIVGTANIKAASWIIGGVFAYANNVNILADVNSNAAIQAVGINTLNANLGAYQAYANATFSVSTYSNTNVQAYIGANVGSYQIFANANAATQATSINTINANLGAFQTYANATFGTSSYSNTQVAAYLLTYPNVNVATLNTTSGNIVTLRTANFNSANAVISGGYISALTNASIVTGTITTINSTNGNITTLVSTNLSTANAVITGGYATGLANISVTGNATVGNLVGSSPNTTIITGAYSSTFDNVGNVILPNLYVSGNTTTMGIAPGYAPNRPAFRVYGGGAGNVVWYNTSNINLKGTNLQVDYNQGSYFDITTGKFTAPVAGLYQTTLVARVGTNNGLNQIAVLKNGSQSGANIVCFWETDTNTGVASHFGTSGVVKLAAGDFLSANILAGNINIDGNDSWTVTYIG